MRRSTVLTEPSPSDSVPWFGIRQKSSSKSFDKIFSQKVTNFNWRFLLSSYLKIVVFPLKYVTIFNGIRVVFTTLHFICNLWMSPISQSVCLWQAFTALCNVTLKLIGPIHKLHLKWSVVNMYPALFIISDSI